MCQVRNSVDFSFKSWVSYLGVGWEVGFWKLLAASPLGQKALTVHWPLSNSGEPALSRGAGSSQSGVDDQKGRCWVRCLGKLFTG